jgi:nucleotide-binding universal stress UspA family protein
MKILIPVDGSEQGNAALDFVASRSTLLGSKPEIRLINVQPTISPRVTRAVGSAQAKAFQRAQADEVLGPAVARLKEAGIRAQAAHVLGSRADAIAAVAVRRRADLVVMGSRGHSALKGLLFGSMTNAVLAGCTKPLLVLRGAKAPRHDSLSVGIAIDGSRFGQAAVRWAVRHRELFGAAPRIELIHVRGDGPADSPPLPGVAYRALPALVQVADEDPLARAFDKVLAGPLKQLAKAGLQAVPVRLRASAAGDAIAAHARKRRLDVLVMGSHGHGAFKSLVLGSVATRVAASCDTPLLLIREASRAAGS